MNLETFVMGDFNIDLSNLQDPNAISVVENLQNHGYLQKIVETTRHAKNNRPTLIDHIYTISEHVLEASNVSLNISDHDLVYVIRKKAKTEKVKLSFKGRSYRHYDKDLFQANLINRNWELFYSYDNADLAWNSLLEAITQEIDELCPIRDIKIKKKKDPWITNELLELINDKNDLILEAKKKQTPECWDNARIARNLVASMVKDAKRDYLTSEIENDQDPGKFWKRLHSIFPDKPCSGKINLIDPANGEMMEEQRIPDYSNDFFTSIGLNIIQETGFDIREWSYKGTVLPPTYSLWVVQIEEVISEIKSLKISKPSGIPNI